MLLFICNIGGVQLHFFLHFMNIGVHVQLPKFGSVDGIEYVDDDTVKVLTAVGYEIGALHFPLSCDIMCGSTISKHLYCSKGKNIRGAPYDWRLGPYSYQFHEFPMMKDLIEETYALNNNTPVALLAMSMGCPYVQAFLGTYTSQDWKVE